MSESRVMYSVETSDGEYFTVQGLPPLGVPGDVQPLVGDVLHVGDEQWRVIRREWHYTDSDHRILRVVVQPDREHSTPRAV